MRGLAAFLALCRLALLIGAEEEYSGIGEEPAPRRLPDGLEAAERRIQPDYIGRESLDAPSYQRHPCYEMECGPGYECDLDHQNKPLCVCLRECPDDRDPRSRVCSTLNITFTNDCELERQKCLCRTGDPRCQNRRYRDAALDYYGPCQKLPTCSESQMEEFPSRMREWLFVIMKYLADKAALGYQARNMVRNTDKSTPRHWVIPVIWKFCDLDLSQDKLLPQQELQPITAPLKPLENCLMQFLRKCDEDRDGNISLKEWGWCLGLKQDEIQDYCDALLG